MYQAVKKIVKVIVPKSLLQKNETWFRAMHASVFYRGKQQHCNICEHHFSRFIILENGDKLCPFCGSISRNRLLWMILSTQIKLKGRVLHFSPSRPLFRKLKKKAGIDYISTDFENEFLADKKLDITNVDEASESFDSIICYHVLEHIADDIQAMRELYRILKKGGFAIIQTPFKEGDIYENDAIVSAKDRLAHFGQADHVRIYSADGLMKRLQSVGFQVDIKVFENIEGADKLGLKAKETVLLCQK